MSLSLGRISFINVAPLYYALENAIVPHPFTFVSAPPSELNIAMREGKLAISSCSCVEYAKNWRNYTLARDLCIASSGPVMSVLLFSQKPFEKLQGETIFLTGQSHTSILLTKLLFKKRFRKDVSFEQANISAMFDNKSKPVAFLTIGDEALRMRKEKDYPYCLDLANAWMEWTKLPFVFALWIMQKELVSLPKDPSLYLRKSRDWGLLHIDTVIQDVLGKTPLSKEELLFYYTHALTYSLGEAQQEGLTYFYALCAEEDLIPEKPKLTFFS